MPLRASLIVAAPAPERVRRLQALTHIAVAAFEDPKAIDPAGLAAIQEIATLSGRAFAPFDFHALPGVESVEAFAERIALGMPPSILDLHRDEIADLSTRVISGKEPYSTYYLEMLSRAFPYAAVSDLIYWPDRERSPTEIADEILRRKASFEADDN